MDEEFKKFLISFLEHYTDSSIRITFEEYNKLYDVIVDILDESIVKKFSRRNLIDKFVKQIMSSRFEEDIIENLEKNIEKFKENLLIDFKKRTFFIPISGIHLTEDIEFDDFSIITEKTMISDFYSMFVKNYNEDKSDIFSENLQILSNKLNKIESKVFFRLKIEGTEDISKDIALNKSMDILSILNLVKPTYYNSFGIEGEVLPLGTSLKLFSTYDGSIKRYLKNLKSHIFLINQYEKLFKSEKFEFLFNLISRKEHDDFENYLLNAIHWYYQSCLIDVNLDLDVNESSMEYGDYFEHYNYYKLADKLIKLVSSVESILIFKNRKSPEIRKKRFNKIMNFNEDCFRDYDDDLDQLYKLRNDVAHSNKEYSFVELNLGYYTNLINRFLNKLIELRIKFDKTEDKSLKSKDDLVKFYSGQNEIEGILKDDD